MEQAVKQVDASPVSLSALSQEEQRRVLVSLLRSGKSDEEIGAMYSLSQWQIRNLRYRLGVKKDRGGNVHVLAERKRRNPGEDASGDGLLLTMRGDYGARELAGRLEGLQAFCAADPEARFHVQLEIREA